jgi:hypothetical protein
MAYWMCVCVLALYNFFHEKVTPDAGQRRMYVSFPDDEKSVSTSTHTRAGKVCWPLGVPVYIVRAQSDFHWQRQSLFHEADFDRIFPFILFSPLS